MDDSKTSETLDDVIRFYKANTERKKGKCSYLEKTMLMTMIVIVALVVFYACLFCKAECGAASTGNCLILIALFVLVGMFITLCVSLIVAVFRDKSCFAVEIRPRLV